jgi:TPR repeat protein
MQIVAHADKCAASTKVCTAAGCLYALADFKADPPKVQEAACTAGRAGVCTSLGVRTWFGDGTARDVPKARVLFERACELHDPVGCVDASKMGQPKFEAWVRSCRDGVGEACLEAGNAIRFGAEATNHTPGDGARLYELGCNLGVANACSRLAFHAGTGLAMPKNDARMFELYDKACRCGDDLGCSGVALSYRDGRGVTQNYNRARETFTRLCKRDVQAACVHLGQMLERGLGITADVNRAHMLYESACNAREADPEGTQGCYMLGKQYRDGKGAVQNDAKAFELFEAACRMAQASSCGELGRWYRDARHAAKDTAKALELFDKACSHGDEDACRDADALRSSP